MEIKHTPGPWSYWINPDMEYYHNNKALIRKKGNFRNSGRDRIVCRLECPDDLAVGNARLIAAAPELLEALKEILASGLPEDREVNGSDGKYTNNGLWIRRDIVSIAEKAIAKAEGK